MDGLKIVCISDTHRMHGYLDMPKGDILIHAGDFTDWGAFNDIKDFSEWLSSLDYKYKIIIAGNHDVKFEHYPEESKFCLINGRKDIIYLNGEMVNIEGLNIFGCPYTPEFGGAFQLDLYEDMKFWKKLIPDKIDILITHGPPNGILDMVQGRNAGSPGLLERVIEVKPKLHIYGHIHEQGCKKVKRYGITFINAAVEYYNEIRKPIMVELNGKT
jgi:Icc-related predicted phosphoesterase